MKRKRRRKVEKGKEEEKRRNVHIFMLVSLVLSAKRCPVISFKVKLVPFIIVNWMQERAVTKFWFFAVSWHDTHKMNA